MVLQQETAPAQLAARQRRPELGHSPRARVKAHSRGPQPEPEMPRPQEVLAGRQLETVSEQEKQPPGAPPQRL